MLQFSSPFPAFHIELGAFLLRRRNVHSGALQKLLNCPKALPSPLDDAIDGMNYGVLHADIQFDLKRLRICGINLRIPYANASASFQHARRLPKRSALFFLRHIHQRIEKGHVIKRFIGKLQIRRIHAPFPAAVRRLVQFLLRNIDREHPFAVGPADNGLSPAAYIEN